MTRLGGLSWTGRSFRAVLAVGAMVMSAIVCSALPASAASKGSITGFVRDKAGNPVAGIEVYAYVAGTTQIVGEVNSAANGSYTEPGLETGEYDLFYFPSGSTGSWLSDWYKHASSEADATPVSVTSPSTTTVDITVRPAATIDGTVTDPSGNPVGGIEVEAYEAGATDPAWESTTASNGTFSEVNLVTGDYDLYYFNTTSPGSWLSEWYKHDSSESSAKAISVTAPSVANVKIHLQAAATITGTVTDSSDNPVPDIDVYAYVAGTTDIAWESVTGTNGSFAETNLVAGSYDLFYFSDVGAYQSGWYLNAKKEKKATPIAVVPPQTTNVQIVVVPTP
jgi:protocatechuate 3,4-dioxygenase beta subunit